MLFRFTRHAKEKIALQKRYGLHVTQRMVKNAVQCPLRVDRGRDDILIANALLDETLLLRVAYRAEGAIMIIITVYPARRREYGL